MRKRRYRFLAAVLSAAMVMTSLPGTFAAAEVQAEFEMGYEASGDEGYAVDSAEPDLADDASDDGVALTGETAADVFSGTEAPDQQAVADETVPGMDQEGEAFREPGFEFAENDGDDELIISEGDLIEEEISEDMDDFGEIEEFLENDDLDEVVQEEEPELADSEYQLYIQFDGSTNLFVKGETIELTAGLYREGEYGQEEVWDESLSFIWTIKENDFGTMKDIAPSAGVSLQPISGSNRAVLSTTYDTGINNVCVFVSVQDAEGTLIATADQGYFSFTSEKYVFECDPENLSESIDPESKTVTFTATVKRRYYDTAEGQIKDVSLDSYDDWGIAFAFDPDMFSLSYENEDGDTVSVLPVPDVGNGPGSWWWSQDDADRAKRKSRECEYIIPCNKELTVTIINNIDDRDHNLYCFGVCYAQNGPDREWQNHCGTHFYLDNDHGNDSDEGIHFESWFDEETSLPVNSSWDIPLTMEGFYLDENGERGEEIIATLKRFEIEGMCAYDENGGAYPVDPDNAQERVIGYAFEPDKMLLTCDRLGYADAVITYTYPCEYTDDEGVLHTEEVYEIHSRISIIERYVVIDVDRTAQDGRMLASETLTLKARISLDWYDETGEEHHEYAGEDSGYGFRVSGPYDIESGTLSNSFTVSGPSCEVDQEKGGFVYTIELAYHGTTIGSDWEGYYLPMEVYDPDDPGTVYETRDYEFGVVKGYYAITLEELPLQFPVGVDVSLGNVDLGLQYISAHYDTAQGEWVRDVRNVSPAEYEQEGLTLWYEWNTRQLYAVSGKQNRTNPEPPVLRRYAPGGSEIWFYVMARNAWGEYYDAASRPFGIPPVADEDVPDELALLSLLGQQVLATANVIQEDNLDLLDGCLSWSAQENHQAVIDAYAGTNDPWLGTAGEELDGYYGGLTLTTAIAPDEDDGDGDGGNGNDGEGGMPVYSISIADSAVVDADPEQGYSLVINGAAPTAAYYAASAVLAAREGDTEAFGEQAECTYTPVADLVISEGSAAQACVDISLQIEKGNGGAETVEPVTAVSVGLEVPEQFRDAERYVLVHELADGSEEEVPYGLDGNTLLFAVPSLSPFRLVNRDLYNVEQLLQALDGDEDEEDKETVAAARAAYERLGDLKEEMDPDLVNILLMAEKSVSDYTAANRVAGMISRLNSNSNAGLADQTAVEEARQAYNALTEDQKKLVGNYSMLTAAEESLDKAKTTDKKAQEEARKAQQKAEAIARFKLNVANGATVPLKVNQTSKKVMMADCADGDSLLGAVSSNSKIVTAKVSGNRLVLKGKKKGKAKITVTSSMGGEIAFFVKVQKAVVRTKKISVSNGKTTITLKKGQTYDLGTILTPVTSPDKIRYSSSQKKVAAVSGKGVIRGKGTGKAKITIKAGKKKKVISVTVTQ